MELQFFCPHWGSEHMPFDEFAARVKNAGYDGVEMSLPFERLKKEAILEVLDNQGLLFIAQHWETIDSQIDPHTRAYEKRLRNLASAGPVFINSQTGKDYFSFDENNSLIQLASAIEKETGVTIVHETHRGKFSFAAHVTKSYLQKLPGLRLTLDISHWCAVAESLLHDQPDAIELAIKHTQHIHARVGYSQGPQVPDPNDILWKEALENHLGWWQKVADARQRSGAKTFTITPEFGAPLYTVLLPGTHQPISDQWENNVFMMEYLKKNLVVE